MHCLVFHVPEMIKKYGNIKQFSGQGNLYVFENSIHNYLHNNLGVEKNNDDAKRNYFSSNMHDPANEVLQAEWRMEHTEEYRRRKRTYTKRNPDYWQVQSTSSSSWILLFLSSDHINLLFVQCNSHLQMFMVVGAIKVCC